MRIGILRALAAIPLLLAGYERFYNGGIINDSVNAGSLPA